MSKEEKMKQLLQMQEHPESYSDEEIRRLMADEECRQLYEQMVRVTDVLVSEQVRAKSRPSAAVPQRRWLRVAASFVGVLVLCGMAYAAVQLWKAAPSPSQTTAETVASAQDTATLPPATHWEEHDSIRVFENATLETILGEMAAYYRYQVTYKSEATKSVRLYFTWNRKLKIEDVVALFNKFERIHITLEERKLTAE